MLKGSLNCQLSSKNFWDAVLEGRPVVVGGSSNRFWLYPGEVIYEEDMESIFIKQCPVTVRTRLTGVNARGQLADISGVDPLAEEFARRFTALYDKLAVQSPIYRELENLFRLVALTKGIRARQADRKVGLDLDYFLKGFPVSEAVVKRHLPGRSAVRELSHTREIPGATETIQLWMPSCGGVDIRIEASSDQFKPHTTGHLAKLRADLLNQRPAEALYWDLPVAPATPLDGLLHSYRLRRINRLNRHSKVFRIVDAQSEYRVYAGDGDPIYQGLDMSEIVRLLEQDFQMNGWKSGYFEMEAFSEDRIEAFNATFRMQLERQKAQLSFGLLSWEAEASTKDGIFSPGIRLAERPREVKIETIAQGEFRGWSRAAVGFLVRMGGAVQRVTLEILGATAAVVQRFLDRLGFNFTAADSLPVSLPELMNQIRWELERDGEIDRKDLEIRIRDEFGRMQIVFLLGEKEVRMA